MADTDLKVLQTAGYFAARVAELEAENARLRGALSEIAEHPESGGRYAIGWAFWNVQRIARDGMRKPMAGPTPPLRTEGESQA